MAQSAAGGLGVPFRQLTARPRTDLRRFRRWRCCRQWHHPCDILTLSPIFYKLAVHLCLGAGHTAMYTSGLLQYQSVHVVPVEPPLGSATPVLPSLYECLHHFEAKSRWDLLLLLSGWVDVPGLKCRPWQFANVSPGSTEPGLHSPHRC